MTPYFAWIVDFVGRHPHSYGGASVFLARFIAVVRAFVPLVAGILRMSSRQFCAANILSALVWAPAHVFPGVLLGMALNLAGLSPGRLAILLIVGLIAVSAAVRALRSYLNRHPFHQASLILPLRGASGATTIRFKPKRQKAAGFTPQENDRMQPAAEPDRR